MSADPSLGEGPGGETSLVPREALAPSAPPVSPTFLRRFLRKPVGVASAVYLVAISLLCALAPLIAPYGPLQQDLFNTATGPTGAHWLGTDALGRDTLSRLLYGGQVTLLGVGVTILTIVLLSVPVGLAAGYLGGRTDRWVNNVTDLLLSVPNIVIVLAVTAIFFENLYAAMITFGVLGSAGVIRVIRSTVLAVREELYVAAARTAGVTEGRIIVRHVMPRVAGPIIVQASLWGGIALGVETGLSFLGVGVAAPAPSWGGAIYDASQLVYQDAFMLVPTGGIVFLTILAFAFLGDAIRDATFEGWSAASRPVARRRGRRSKTARVVEPSSGAPVEDLVVSSSPDVVLDVSHLSVIFSSSDRDITIVDDVSFELCRGEVLGLVGESGSGKSVTALSLLGLLPSALHVSRGRIVHHGVDLVTLSDNQLSAYRGTEIAIVFQEPMSCLDPSFTVGSQVAEVVRRHDKISRKAARARVMELFEQVRLPRPSEVAARFPHELSGGMAQRVCIALALAGRPQVLIADEPTTALDVTVQSEILELLRTLREETGLSILLVTHDWGVVADLCDRAVVMYAGEIVEQAAVEPLFIRPLHPYTRGLQLCNPALAEDNERLPSIPGSVPAPHNWPQGCRFQDRCDFATPECADQAIELGAVGEDRLVRCRRWTTLAEMAEQMSPS